MSKIRGLNNLKRRFTQAGKAIDDELDKATQKATLTARNTAIQRAPIDKGQLRQGINFNRLGKRHYRLRSQMHYTLPQEFGTGSAMEVPTNIDEELREAGLKFKYSPLGLGNPRAIKPKLFMSAGYWVAKSYLDEQVKRIMNKKR